MRRSDFGPKSGREQHATDGASPPARFRGRFTAPDRRDYSCRTIDMSAEVVALHSDYAPAIGARIALHLEQWGRFDGTVIRTFNGGFTVDLEVADRSRAQVAMQLAWLLRHQLLEDAPVRGHERVVPNRPFTTFTVADVTLPCEIRDISRRGAALKTDVKVQNGVKLTVGKRTPAEVVRQTEDGFAVQFRRLLPLEAFDEDIEL